MEHKISQSKKSGRTVVITIPLIYLNEIEKNGKLIKCLNNQGIGTTNAFLKKIKNKKCIRRFSDDKEMVRLILELYEKIEFRLKTYKNKVFKFLNELNNANFRMENSDVNYIATSIIFHDILKVDSWEFMMPLLSTKAQENISCNEKKWHAIYFSCL